MFSGHASLITDAKTPIAEMFAMGVFLCSCLFDA